MPILRTKLVVNGREYYLRDRKLRNLKSRFGLKFLEFKELLPGLYCRTDERFYAELNLNDNTLMFKANCRTIVTECRKISRYIVTYIHRKSPKDKDTNYKYEPVRIDPYIYPFMEIVRPIKIASLPLEPFEYEPIDFPGGFEN
jgi:hypothetical protein